MAEILKGAPVVAAINEKLAARTEKLKAKGVTPTLAIVRIGERGDDIAYQLGATKRCQAIGVNVRAEQLAADISQQALIEKIKQLNAEPSVHGVLLLRPLPKNMDDALVRNTLAPEKDIDGITDGSLAGVFTCTDKGYPPCTARACMEILDYYGYDLTGKRAAVVGRSLVVGKPVSIMLQAKNATVTMCHTRTQNLDKTCQDAQVLIVSAGKAKAVGAAALAPGQIVIDVGINVDDAGKMCGDVDFEAAEKIVAGITPVPGGVGTVTTSVLVGHVVASAEKAANTLKN